MPRGPDLPARLPPVLAVVYLIFNEGYSASSGGPLIREDLCAEAIRLGRLLAALMSDEAEVKGLLTLMLLTESRHAAREAGGGPVLLADQDRRLWDRALVAEGRELVRQCLRQNQPGPYQLQAAISAVHSDSSDGGATDWRQILRLYDRLLELAPGPVVGEVATAYDAALQLARNAADRMFLEIRLHEARRRGRRWRESRPGADGPDPD